MFFKPIRGSVDSLSITYQHPFMRIELDKLHLIDAVDGLGVEEDDEYKFDDTVEDLSMTVKALALEGFRQ